MFSQLHRAVSGLWSQWVSWCSVNHIGLYEGYGFTELVGALSPVRPIGLYQGYGFTGLVSWCSVNHIGLYEGYGFTGLVSVQSTT